ncbi:MAG: hypothetical protein COB36_11995 [Alphaproteobacteria bacterium]|nr:MAG: hypothetical protein COB36_11995 [Alphaproteobacteria bacterium]
MTVEIMEMMASLINRIESLEDQVKKLSKKTPMKRFVKPGEYELGCYFHDKGSNTCQDDAKAFIDHYESNGWKVGKNPMKNWQAAARNWMKGKSNATNNIKRLTTANDLDLDAIDY